MDRYDEKAREICERIGRDRAAFITDATEALTAAILRAAAEMSKAGETGKPAAGEWKPSLPPRQDTHFQRYVAGAIVAAVETYMGVSWRVYTIGAWTEESKSGRAGTVEAAMAAADAWARAHAAELDWRLPDDPARPTAPQPTATVEEVIDTLGLEATFIPIPRLRRALSALSPEQRAVMVAAIKVTP